MKKSLLVVLVLTVLTMTGTFAHAAFGRVLYRDMGTTTEGGGVNCWEVYDMIVGETPRGIPIREGMRQCSDGSGQWARHTVWGDDVSEYTSW